MGCARAADFHLRAYFQEQPEKETESWPLERNARGNRRFVTARPEELERRAQNVLTKPQSLLS